MPSDPTHRAPGDGADRPTHHLEHRGYVYVARSRRAGGLSLGVDLTPHGHCSFSCIYCQASHPPTSHTNLKVDVAVLAAELEARLTNAAAAELRDLVLAGSGEPTAAPNFEEAAETIQRACSSAGFTRPRRVFTNGRHLDRASVLSALQRWCDSGGEVWVKLDAATDDTLRLLNGREVDAARHLQGLWQLARLRPVGVQTMVVEGPGLPAAEAMAEEVSAAIQAGLQQGARISELHLLTLARVPAELAQAETLRAVPTERLEAIAQRMRELTGLRVTAFGAR